MTYKPMPIINDGNQKEALVSDNDVVSVLNKILKELIKMNIHMELITDEKIDNKEIN